MGYLSYTYARARARTRARTHTYTHAHTHTHTRKCARAHIHTHTHAPPRARTHTHRHHHLILSSSVLFVFTCQQLCNNHIMHPFFVFFFSFYQICGYMNILNNRLITSAIQWSYFRRVLVFALNGKYDGVWRWQWPGDGDDISGLDDDVTVIIPMIMPMTVSDVVADE